VLVVVRVVAPAELVAVLRDGGEEVVAPREARHVVAGLLERVLRVGDLDRAVVAPADEEVLELETDLVVVAELLRPGELVAEDRPRAVRPRLALDGDVAGEARKVRLPRNEREAAQVRDGGDVRVARHLADLAGREAGEPSAVVGEVVEVRSGDELRARTAVH